MKALRNLIAWTGWIIIVIIAFTIWRAPGSAKHAYWWAVRKTLNPVTTMGSLDNFRIDDSKFNAPERYFPENYSGLAEGILKVFREPSIYTDTAHPAVRLLYDRSFFDPVMVKLSYEEGRWVLASKRATAGVHIPFHIDFEKKVPVPESFVDNLKASLDRIGFWSMPTNSENAGLDGASWILEVRLDGRYRVVDQWSPDDKSEYKKLCVMLLKKGDVAGGPLF